MQTAQVEKVTHDNREFVSGETDIANAYRILKAIVRGYGKEGYLLASSMVDKKLPKDCAILVKGNETIGLRVVCNE